MDNPSHNLEPEDINVLIDMIIERMPYAWIDAEEEISNGRNLEEVLKEMETGHTIRILKRLGYNPQWWLDEFREWHNG